MEIILMNMCMIHNKKTNEVLVLDKFKKEGWEGMTFPGGHVEKIESLNESCIREVKEETNLKVDNLLLKGSFQWYMLDDNKRLLGLLYYTDTFSGELIKESDEGNLNWIDYEEFLKMREKSDSMDEILKVYNGEYSEIICYYRDDELVDIEYIR